MRYKMFHMYSRSSPQVFIDISLKLVRFPLDYNKTMTETRSILYNKRHRNSFKKTDFVITVTPVQINILEYLFSMNQNFHINELYEEP